MSVFPKYERYKESGTEWLGQIPEHWTVSKTRWLWREVEDPSQNGDEQLLSISQYTGVTPTNSESRSESLVGYRRCKPDDLAMNIMLAWQGGLGVSDYEGIVSPAYSVFRLRGNNNPHYLGYLYRTKRYLDEFGRNSTGIVPSRWRLYPDKFGHILTLLPPKPEQDRIVAFLDQKTGEIDALIAKKQRQIELLDEQKAILINRAVTRGLNPNAKLKPSGIEWIGEIPEHWEVKPLRWFCRIRSGDFVESAHSSTEQTETKNIPIFGGNGLMGYTHRFNSPPNTMVLGRVGALCGNVHVTTSPTWVTDNALILSVQNPFLLRYTELSLRCLDLNRLAAKNAQPLITGGVIKAQYLPLPPLEEQQAVAEAVKQLSEDSLASKNGVERQIKSLKTLRSTLIAHAVTGRIKIN